MISFIISNNTETTDKIVSALEKFEEHHINVCQSPETLLEEVLQTDKIDVLIDTTNSLDGLQEKILKEFPKIKICTFNEDDKSNIQEWLNRNQLHPQVSITRTTPRSPVNPIRIDDSKEEEKIPLANTLTAPGKKLGDYELLRFIRSEGDTEVHEAIQLSIDRKVALILLNPKLSKNENSVNGFRELVRAKAKVSHPHIAAIYEGHEEEGTLFYTSELISGQNLSDAHHYGIKLSEEHIIRILKTVVETQLYLTNTNIPHQTLKASHIYLSSDGMTRIANTAINHQRDSTKEEGNIRYLGQILQEFIDESKSKTGSILLEVMRHQSGPSTWKKLQHSISESEEGLSELLHLADGSMDPSHNMSRIWAFTAISLIIAIVTAYLLFNRNIKSPEPIIIDSETMIRIEGGEFTYQKDITETLPTFWIDKYEVTIAQYKAFLDAINSLNSKEFIHPDQPIEKFQHKPNNWDEYYAAARLGKEYEGNSINLNCPVIYVDWWDAYAYAKWKNHRLPSEKEWEKSARGKYGRLYPWGNELKALEPRNDKFMAWKPMDTLLSDVSEEGVGGLFGNVSEWTSSQEPDPEILGEFVPIVRGGNFNYSHSKMPQVTTRKILNSRNYKTNYIGFRTVSDTDPNLDKDVEIKKPDPE